MFEKPTQKRQKTQNHSLSMKDDQYTLLTTRSSELTAPAET